MPIKKRPSRSSLYFGRFLFRLFSYLTMSILTLFYDTATSKEEALQIFIFTFLTETNDRTNESKRKRDRFYRWSGILLLDRKDSVCIKSLYRERG